MYIHITLFQQYYYTSCRLHCSLIDPFTFQGSLHQLHTLYTVTHLFLALYLDMWLLKKIPCCLTS